MARGNSFGNFKADFKKDVKNFKVKPIMGEFGGAAPDSIYASNVQSVWARWRRGMELAAAKGACLAVHVAARSHTARWQSRSPAQPSGAGVPMRTMGAVAILAAVRRAAQ